MKISIFGLGYVGCVSLGCLAQFGHKVIGVDINQNKVDLINKGKPTIVEKDIDTIIADQHKNGFISATKDYTKAIENSSVSIICVGTPTTEQGHLNLDYIFKTAEEIGSALKAKREFHVVVIRSTVMPGTNRRFSLILEEKSGKKSDLDFAVVSNPEFLREGTAVADYLNPPYTVIGSSNNRATAIMQEIYQNIDAPFYVKDIEVAEIIKYINNSFHALKVSFANEVGNICKSLNIDSHDVMDLFVKDDQLNISPYYLKPGFAYGGSCLPKDLKGLTTLAHDNYLQVPVLNAISKSNDLQIENAYKLIVGHNKRHIGILGLSFKEGTDDLRFSPIVAVVEMLLGKGYEVSIYDENVSISRLTGTNKDYIDRHLPHLSSLLADDPEKVVNASEVIVVTQKDSRFQALLKQHPKKPVIDLIRLYNKKSSDNYTGICW